MEGHLGRRHRGHTVARAVPVVPEGTIDDQAITDTITDPETTSVVLVTTPAELPVIETLESLDVITDEGLCPAPTVVMNRSLAHATFGVSQIEALPAGPFREAAVHQLDMERFQGIWEGAITADITLPYLMGVFTPGEVALRLADSLATP